MIAMAVPEDQKKISNHLKPNEKIEKNDPEWTSGLKRLYDSVLDEPLPDSFMALLSKLDENDSK